MCVTVYVSECHPADRGRSGMLTRELVATTRDDVRPSERSVPSLECTTRRVSLSLSLCLITVFRSVSASLFCFRLSRFLFLFLLFCLVCVSVQAIEASYFLFPSADKWMSRMISVIGRWVCFEYRYDLEMIGGGSKPSKDEMFIVSRYYFCVLAISFGYCDTLIVCVLCTIELLQMWSDIEHDWSVKPLPFISVENLIVNLNWLQRINFVWS